MRTGDRGTGSFLFDRWFTWFVTLGLLAAMLASVPLERLPDALAATGIVPIGACALLGAIDGLLFDADKLRRIMRRLGFPVSFGQAAALSYPATVLGAVLPAQVEEVLKARMISTGQGVGVWQGMGVVALDRGLNLMAHAALLCGGIVPVVLGLGDRPAILAMSAATILGGVLILAMVTAFASSTWLRKRPLVGALAEAFSRTSFRFKAAMVAYAAAMNVAFAAVLMWMAGSAGIPVSFHEAVLWKTGATLMGKIPVSAGGFGVREGSLALGLSLRGDPTAGVAVALAFGVASTLTPAAVTLPFRHYLRRALAQARQDAAAGVSRLKGPFTRRGD